MDLGCGHYCWFIKKYCNAAAKKPKNTVYNNIHFKNSYTINIKISLHKNI